MSLLFEKCMAGVLTQIVPNVRTPEFFISCQVCYKGCHGFHGFLLAFVREGKSVSICWGPGTAVGPRPGMWYPRAACWVLVYCECAPGVEMEWLDPGTWPGTQRWNGAQAYRTPKPVFLFLHENRAAIQLTPQSFFYPCTSLWRLDPSLALTYLATTYQVP